MIRTSRNHLEFLRNSSRVPEISHEISPSSPLQHRPRRARKVQDSLCRPSHEQLAVRAWGLSYQRGKSKEIEQPKMMKNVDSNAESYGIMMVYYCFTILFGGLRILLPLGRRCQIHVLTMAGGCPGYCDHHREIRQC